MAEAPGRFPLLLFAHGSVETESVMCEYLASYGYVVAAVRSRGASDPVYRLSRENLDAVVADHDLVASRMLREPNVANSPIGVIGMSNGAIVAMALQLRRPVGAIVSLDGGIGENAGGTYLRERSGGNVATLQAPLLHFYAPNNPHLNLDHRGSITMRRARSCSCAICVMPISSRTRRSSRLCLDSRAQRLLQMRMKDSSG